MQMKSKAQYEFVIHKWVLWFTKCEAIPLYRNRFSQWQINADKGYLHNW